jgi:hypothetical protein
VRLLLVALALAGSLGVGGCTSCPTALLDAVLASNGDSLGTVGGDGVWRPIRVREGLFGYGIRRDPDGFVITDFLGGVVAREGDRIQAGGGVGGDGVSYVCNDVRVVSPAG